MTPFSLLLPANILDNFALRWGLSKEDVGPLNRCKHWGRGLLDLLRIRLNGGGQWLAPRRAVVGPAVFRHDDNGFAIFEYIHPFWVSLFRLKNDKRRKRPPVSRTAFNCSNPFSVDIHRRPGLTTERDRGDNELSAKNPYGVTFLIGVIPVAFLDLVLLNSRLVKFEIMTVYLRRIGFVTCEFERSKISFFNVKKNLHASFSQVRNGGN
jgi:hypothetical protein